MIRTEIQTYFEEAKKFRDELPITSQGALYTTHDLHMDIPDHPGISFRNHKNTCR